MTLPFANRSPLPSLHFLADIGCDILSGIHTEGVGITIWERTPPREAIDLLHRYVARNDALSIDTHLRRTESVRDQFEVPALSTRVSDGSALRIFSDDIDDLVNLFRKVSGSETVRLRLNRVVDAACSVFHTDNLSLRLLCTYHGAGTQWVPAPLANHKQLGLRGRSMQKANAAIVPNATSIRTMSPWHVGVLKGRDYKGDGRSAIIHRSHPQCCAAHARIRLTLDMAG